MAFLDLAKAFDSIKRILSDTTYKAINNNIRVPQGTI